MIQGRSKRGQIDRLSPFAYRKAKAKGNRRHHHRCAICEAAKHLSHVQCTIHRDRSISESIEVESSPPPLPSSPGTSPKNLEQALLNQEQKLRDEFKRERELFRKEENRLKELMENMQKEFGGLKARVERKKEEKTISKDTTTTKNMTDDNASALRELEKRVIDRIDTHFEEQKRHEEEMFSNLNREQEQQVHYDDDDDADEELILDTDTNDLIIIVPNDQVRILSDGRSMVRVPADRAKRVVAEIVDCDLEVRRRRSLLKK